MKGTVISIILGVVVYWSLNHETMEPFFKIKRKRLYKSNNFEETSSKINKVSSGNSLKKKQLRQAKVKPPIK